MRLTVGIPAFNAEETIGLVVRAVRRQIREGDRVLAVDDGSTDRTAAVAEACGAEVIGHRQNTGLAAARNTLLSHAATDLIAYLDADAVPAPGTLDALRNGFSADDVAATGGRGIETDRTTGAARWRASVCPQDHGDAVIEDDWMLMGICACFRADALRAIAGFDPEFARYGEDADASLRLRRAGYRLRYLPEAVVYHMKPDGFAGVLRQGHRHALYASRALVKNDGRAILADYRRDIRAHLLRNAASALSRGRVDVAVTALANVVWRLAGSIRGAAYHSRAIRP